MSQLRESFSTTDSFTVKGQPSHVHLKPECSKAALSVKAAGKWTLSQEHKQNEIENGTKMLVLWKDTKSKKATKRKFPAEIVKISDDKDWLLKYMREDDSPVKTGKGFRVINDSDSDTERQQEPAATKRQKAASKNAEQSKRSTNLANMIKERYRKESLKLFDDNSVCDEDCKHLRENRTLLATIKHLKSENERLREQIESSDDLKVSLRKLKKYVASLEGFSNQAPKFGSQQSVRAYEPSARLSPLTTMDHGRSSPISCVSSSSTRSSPTSMSGFSEFATEEPTVIAISEDNLLKDKSKEIQGCDDDN
ncbi:uncharacterized protein LOC114544867 [Dendronephthya gigantea]|uniref:uncharacterized protein LOC114544867 n=1 Tax=Dendronephthya gigantea TaxID=151771 RepID=UPI00106C87A0|nr:uncharacterized protein LOC114544867 [Dendronephthya gigantea]